MVEKKGVLALVMVLLALGTQAARRTVLLSGDGWTCDGAPVTVPHSWNGVDGADGKPVEDVEPVLLPALATAQTSVPANTYVRKAATYARTLPDPVPGKRYFVRCEGASVKAEVRVNGTSAGRHAGAFTSFAFEVTKLLKPSGNGLEIVVDNRYDPDVPPIMGDFTVFGGLYRDVWLVETDPVCIDPLRDGGPGVDVTTFADGRVEARTFVNGAADAEVRYEIDGREYATGSFKVPDVELWSPETPRVYELKVTARSGSSEDSVVLPIGFRDVKFTQNGFFLNGKRRVIRGVNRHQDWDGKGWAITREDERTDVGWMKRMGADGVRGCHYPQSDSYYSVCDAEGLMAWCEVSFVNDMTDSAAFRTNLLTMAREMVVQRKHHPSIVCWGLFNELYSCTKTPNGTMEPLIRDEKELIRGLDPSRITVAASNRLRKPELNSIPDFVTFNVYHGWYGGRYNDEWWYEGSIDGTEDLLAMKMIAKLREANGLGIVGLGEYGAAGAIAVHGDYLGYVRYSEEYQALVHRANYRSIIRDPKVWGAFIWEMFDSGSDSRQEIERPGINNKGLVTYDRKEAKDAFWFYKANWNPEPMLHLVGARMTETTNATATVCGFSNAGDVTLTVNGREIGTKTPDEVRCAIWKGVPLVPGANRIELRCGGRTATAVWTRRSLPAPMKAAALGDVKLTGWIGKKAENLFRERVTSDWARNVMMKECEDAFIARKDDAGELGLWQGEYWGKTMIGFAQIAEYRRSPELLRFIRESCARVMALQEPDGYLGTYTNRLFLKVHVDPERLRREHHVRDHNWNVWCRSFTAWGLYEAARVTGERAILEAGARSLVQLIDMLHGNGISITDTGTNAGLPSCTVLTPVLLYYEATKDAKFLDFAKEIVAAWSREEDVPPNFFRHAYSGLSPYSWYEGAPFQFDWPKANETLICLQGLVEYARIADDARALDVCERMAALLRRHERNSIFTVGFNDRFHEAATVPSALTETCDTVMWLQLLKKLYLATGKAVYADELELVYLNPFLAGMTRDGTWGNRGVRSHGRHAAGPAQAGMKYSHCCVNNLPRGFMEFAPAELAKDADGAYRVAFYTDAEAELDDVRLSVTGNWPVDDVANVRIVAKRPATLLFRAPAWSPTMTVNGRAVRPADGWWRTEVPAGESSFALGFDLAARLVPLQAKPDPRNATKDVDLARRWMCCDRWDLLPYFHMKDLPRIMRGPLLLAKSTRIGADEAEVFGWGTVFDCEKTKVETVPLAGQDVWGAWTLRLLHPTVRKDGGCYFETKVCDFQSAGDSHDTSPTKTFCIFY